MNNPIHCSSGCTHERHQKYLHLFKDEALVGQPSGVFEAGLLWHTAKYVLDSNISPNDADDLELFHDLIFESKFGRLHIYFYEQYLFPRYFKFNPGWVMQVFSKYLEFLERISPLFTNDAFDFIYRHRDSKLVLMLLDEMSFDIKMRFIKHADKHPDMMRLVPKLKLYNLFS
jgi:hypothetical protein